MALKLKYTDECGILHINMSPSASPRLHENRNPPENETKTDIIDPKFDTINNRFGQYDLFGGKYDVEIGGETSRSLFRSRYNSVEEELANTPYAFATERTLRLTAANDPLHITIDSRASSDDASPSKDLLDDRFFNRNLNLEYDDGLFGPQIDFSTKSYVKTSDEEETPAFTVTQLIHAQDRYFDLSSRHSSSVVSDSPKTGFLQSDPTKIGKVKSLRNSFEVRSAPGSAKKERTVKIVERFGSVKSKTEREQAFKVLSSDNVKAAARVEPVSTAIPVVPTSKRKREQSFAILTETPLSSRPSSPRSLPPDFRTSRISPFKGRGFREETSRHTTPRTSAANSRASSPPRRRTNSLSRIDKMSQAATLSLPVPNLSRPHSPRNFLKENIQEVREISEFNREKHEAEEERRKREEEEALLKEMGLLEKNAKSEGSRSTGPSRTTSRSNSPSKIKIRSRSNSPSAVLQFENIPIDSKDFVTPDVEVTKPATHKSRVRTVSKSKPQSNGVSPKNSKIPRRQNSVSPSRVSRVPSHSRKPMENGLTHNQRFISNSTSSIHETIKIGSQVHDKRGLSKSTQYLDISPAHISGKPPISPGRGGPPPSNRSINSKRLSPIIGTPSKSPIEDQKPSSARTITKPSPVPKKPIRTAGNTPATSRLNSRLPSRASSRDPSPEKRTKVSRTTSNKTDQKPTQIRQVNRTPSTKTTQKPSVSHIPEPKKTINRTNSMKSLVRTPSTKALNEKPPIVKKDSKKDSKALSTSKINEIGMKKLETNKNQKSDDKKDTSKEDEIKSKKEEPKQKKEDSKKKESKSKDDNANKDLKKAIETTNEVEEVTTQDNETQYDTITNEKGELVLLTKKNVISMTTAAITAQPLEVVTTVTNQLPGALERAREKGIFERLNSRDSLSPKENEREDIYKEETVDDNEVYDDKNTVKTTKTHTATIFAEDNIKMKPLQPPYNNPQVERVKQKIDDILKSPEVSSEKIFAPIIDTKQTKNSFKTLADRTKNDIKKSKNETTNKFTELKDLVIKQNDKTTADIRSEATKIVNSIITPVEDPKSIQEKAKEEVKNIIEPIVMVVNEKKSNGPTKTDIVEKINETLVKGGPDVEVQSSNLSTPANTIRITVRNDTSDGDRSDKSLQSNGGFPQSTSTAPKPPPRTNRSQSPKGESIPSRDKKHSTSDVATLEKKPNLCQRLIGKCKSKCCSCCVKPKDDEEKENKGFRKLNEETKKEEAKDSTAVPEKKGLINKLNCCKKDKEETSQEKTNKDVEKTVEKKTKIEFENETKRKRKLRDVLCGCCGRRRRISDVSSLASRQVSDVASDVPATPSDVLTSPGDHVVQDAGCCGKKKAKNERRDSILSDPPTNTNSCCNNRVGNWLRGALHRRPEHSSSRRTSMFSKNKSLSPTLPPEDNRPKLDPTLVEHTSVMRGAVPVLPPALAYFCLVCNVIVPGLGTIFSGMFCLCFGIPRFGVHDGARQRMGSFFINLLVGCGQLFTVLFCLVGWGWSIWWGVIMVKIARRYRKLKAEAAAAEEEAAPPITDNNHTAA